MSACSKCMNFKTVKASVYKKKYIQEGDKISVVLSKALRDDSPIFYCSRSAGYKNEYAAPRAKSASKPCRLFNDANSEKETHETSEARQERL